MYKEALFFINMKNVYLQYGSKQVGINVPSNADLLKSKQMKILRSPAKEILTNLKKPIGTKSLAELAQGRKSATIVVSDNTRPVPYKGPNGILSPIIKILKKQKIRDIVILIACGTHHQMTKSAIKKMLGNDIFRKGINIINHVATDKSMLRTIGRTPYNPNVTVNAHYLDADLKILTGLVEPHFMAGFSGGRKAICPGICGQDVTYGFHSAKILSNANSTSLNLKGNPCHEESLRIAKMAGADFIVNVTINDKKKLTGIFCGDLEKAHSAAVKYITAHSIIKLKKEYDIVLTQAGSVGINHYQCAKAAIEASRAVKPGGIIIISASLTDSDIIGGKNYKKMLNLLAEFGAKKFLKTLMSSKWDFVPEQWQVQMWARVFEKLGDFKKLYICSPQLDKYKNEIPGINVASEIKRFNGENDVHYAGRLLQRTIDNLSNIGSKKTILILPEGPYVVPSIR